MIEFKVDGAWVPKGSRTGKKEAEASVVYYKKTGIECRAVLYVPEDLLDELVDPTPGAMTMDRKPPKRRRRK